MVGYLILLANYAAFKNKQKEEEEPVCYHTFLVNTL